jgi:hypothetical protein
VWFFSSAIFSSNPLPIILSPSYSSSSVSSCISNKSLHKSVLFLVKFYIRNIDQISQNFRYIWMTSTDISLWLCISSFGTQCRHYIWQIKTMKRLSNKVRAKKGAACSNYAEGWWGVRRGGQQEAWTLLENLQEWSEI